MKSTQTETIVEPSTDDYLVASPKKGHEEVYGPYYHARKESLIESLV